MQPLANVGDGHKPENAEWGYREVTMNAKEKRQIAAGAARTELRRLGSKMTIQNAEIVLDEMARREPNLVASQWWTNASDNQYKLWKREWRQKNAR